MTIIAEAFCLDCIKPDHWLYSGGDGRAAYQKAKKHTRQTGHECVWRVINENTIKLAKTK